MKPAEIRELPTEDLHARIAELKEELFNLRFQLATGQLDNHRRMREVRRDMARIRTILRERDFAFAARAAAEATPLGGASDQAPAAAQSSAEPVATVPGESEES